jgi:hydrogenase nickel incorporation protein HypB
MHEVADEHKMESILSRNDELAQHNREHFDEAGTYVVNLMSAPGAGKTTLLAATIPELGTGRCAVIEGDMVGELDADRLKALSITCSQISTGRSCHLSAEMVARVVHNQDLLAGDFLFVENVGNLVCPAEFPLGEHLRVVLLSVTEGADKPLKYPVIFRNCDAVVFTKTDLLPYVEFDLKQAEDFVRSVNPAVEIFSISTKTKAGISEWLQWLEAKRKA